jgi:hypothetical protein
LIKTKPKIGTNAIYDKRGEGLLAGIKMNINDKKQFFYH